MSRRGAQLLMLTSLAACAADAGPPATMPAGSAPGVAPVLPAAPVQMPSSASQDASAPAADAALATPAAPKSQAEQILQGSCATSTVKSSLRPANLLFVLDRTGTMACNPPPTTSSLDCERTPTRASAMLPSKWEITRDALRTALATLPSSSSVGMSYFSNDSVCGVNATPSVALAPVSSAHVAALDTSLGGVTPGGGTPLVGAVVLAYRHLHELALARKISGNTFVVLLSDGEQSEECSNPPTCSSAASCYQLLLERELPKAAGPGVGIRTFVIGAPGSEPSRSTLSKIAKAGGTAAAGCDVAQGNCHFDMTRSGNFGESLSLALRSILGEAISCELDVPRPADGKEPDRGAINVVYRPSKGEPMVVPQDKSAPCEGGAQGWQFTEGPDARIRVCGRVCDTIRADAAGQVNVVLGCPAVVLL